MKNFSNFFIVAFLAGIATLSSAQTTVTIEPTNQSVTVGGTAYFYATISSNGYCGGNFAGQWLFNGTNIPSIITTFAGNGTYGYSGDGGLATGAELSDPNSAAFDPFGNLYIGDGGNNVIRMVDTNGIITTVAGGGTGGGTDTYGDGGPATNATFNNVLFVSFDPSGNYYVVDQYDGLVRKVDTNGIITVFAGGGGGSGGSDGIGDDGPATNAILNDPTSVTFDHLGNAYISDNNDNVIRKVDTNGIITVFAGTYYGYDNEGYDGDGSPATNAQLSSPNGLAVDTLGNLYISDSDNNVIRMVDTNGYIWTVAGDYYSGWSWTGDGGPATSAGLNFPNDIWVDGFGNIYIADNLNSLVREVNRATGIITTIAGNGTSGYSGDGGAPTNAEISAGGVAVNTFGDLYIFGSGDSAVRRVSNVLMQDGFLAVQNVTTNDEGAYQAVVSSFCGNITSSVANIVVMDTNGLSYDWEMEYFGQTGLNPNELDARGIRTLLYDYIHGINPTDYYDGNLPILTITPWIPQNWNSFAGETTPLSVIVSDAYGNLLVNAPITFSVSGPASLALMPPEPTDSVQHTVSDTNGIATVYLVFPSNPYGVTNIITAAAVCGTNIVQVIFTESTIIRPMIAAGDDAIENSGGFGDDFLLVLNPMGDVDGLEGWNDWGEIGDTTNSIINNITQIAAGPGASYAVDVNGNVWAWGDDTHGQLGDGNTNTSFSVPVLTLGISNVVNVAGGDGIAGAVDNNGNVWLWGGVPEQYITDVVFGYGGPGRYGTNLLVDSSVPVPVSGITNAVSVALGEFHVMALLADGTVWSWGGDSFGQLGDGTTNYESTAVRCRTLTNIVQIAAGYDFSLALQSNGVVWAWGDNNSGELGTDSTNSYCSYPMSISFPTNIIQISAGAYDAMALGADGTLWTWGDNTFGELGVTNVLDQTNQPVEVLIFTNFISITAGGCLSSSSYAMDGEGNIWGWGYLPQTGIPVVQTSLTQLPDDVNPPTNSLVLGVISPGIFVTQPVVQIQVYSSRPIAQMAYDLSNPAGTITNQSTYEIGEYYDPNLDQFTTNYFECYNVAVTNGLNTLTLHAIDLASNEITTNMYFIVNYTYNKTPPGLTIIWPQNGTPLSGSNFTLQAQVTDPTVTVTASIVDSNGDTNTVQGLVEQNGVVWAENLPLVAGSNTLSVAATDLLGNQTATNLIVTQSSVTLTMTPLTSDQLNQQSVNVTGTVSDVTSDIFVNGVEATSSNGTWVATDVPVSPADTATFHVQAYVGDPDLEAETNSTQPQPPMVVLSSYSALGYLYTTDSLGVANFQESDNWSWNSGGNAFIYLAVSGSAGFVGPGSESEAIPPDANGYSLPQWDYILETFNPVWENSAVTYFDGTNFLQRTNVTKVMLVPGGGQAVGTTGTYLVLAHASEFSVPPMIDPDWDVFSGFWAFLFSLGPPSWYEGNVPLPPEWLQINKHSLVNTGITNVDGSVWGATLVQAQAGIPVDVTPMATQFHTNNDYTFDVKAYQLVSQCVATTPANQARTNLGVGEQVNLSFNPPLTNINWSATAGSLSAITGSTNQFTAPTNSENVNIIAMIGNYQMTNVYQVFAPTGYVRAQIYSVTTNYDPNEAGAGMINIIWIGPTNVSFNRVWMEEVGEIATNATGYFADTNIWPVGNLNHGLHGANNWFQLYDDNTWADEADSGICDTPWSNGNFTWPIPAAWQIGTNSPTTNYMTGWNQNFLIDASGTVTVQKFGNSVTRTTNGLIRITE